MSHGPPQLVLVGTGSEVQTLEQAVPLLEGVRVQLVSMPCCELFDSQPREYKHEVPPPCVCRPYPPSAVLSSESII